jgi:metallo-beta-lactamase class B
MPLMQHRFTVPTLLLTLALTGCQSAQVAPRGKSVRVADDVTLQPIVPGVWVHTTYFDVPDSGRTGANGLLVVSDEDAVLIDLPWTDEQTAALFDWVAKNTGATVKIVVPTHFHQESMGGLAEAHRRGATSYGLDKTISLARRDHLPVPKSPFQLRTGVRCGKDIILLAYLGAAHTTDNIVAWLPKEHVLFALGNATDGDLTAYPTTLKKLKSTYRNAKIVVPGRGDWGGPELIDHTLKLSKTKDAQ